nr:unnamed protein product [Callosobruchus analis]
MSDDESGQDVVEENNCGKEKCLKLFDGDILYSKLQCVACGKHLSVKPVSQVDGQYQCGRCCPQAKQCLLYAAVAEHFIFPCIFRDCEEDLKWGNVKSHEKTCFYREVSCPFPDGDLIIEGLVESTPSYEKLHCIQFRGMTFLAFVKIRKQSCCGNMRGCFQYGVFCISNGKKVLNLLCEVKINSDYCVSKILDCDDVKELNDTQHCMSCLNEFCAKPDHTNIGDTFLTDNLEFRTSGKPFSYTIQVYKKSHLKTLPIVECPICNADFNESDSILLCPTGHSLCSACYDNVGCCPFCRVTLANKPARNFALEELVTECTSTQRG